MATKVWGYFDDEGSAFVKIEGDIGNDGNEDDNEGIYINGTTPSHNPGADDVLVAQLVFSDGTHLEIQYEKCLPEIWDISTRYTGDLFAEIQCCEDPKASLPSDVALFEDGLEHVMFCDRWLDVC